MARLGPLGIATCIAVGVVTAIAVLPVASWSFRNQRQMLTSGARPIEEDWYRTSAAFIRFQESDWDVLQKDGSLARAMAAHRGWMQRSDSQETPYFERLHLKYLEQHFRRFPNDLLGVATYVRILCQAPMVTDARDIAKKKLPSQSDADVARNVALKRAIAAKLKALAEKGKELDPENAYFSFVRAMTLNVLGKPNEARREIYHAATLRKHEDYAVLEGETLIRAAERSGGYRGEAFRTLAYASIVFPQLASMKGAVSEMRRLCPPNEALKLQWALFQTHYTLALDSETLIEILVGKAGIRLSVAYPGEFSSQVQDEALRDAQLRRFLTERVEELRSKLRQNGLLKPGIDPLAMFEEVEELSEVGRQVVDTSYDPPFDEILLLRWSHWSSRILAGMIGLGIAGFAVRRWAIRSSESYDRSRGAMAAAMVGLNLLVVLSADGSAFMFPVSIVVIPFVALAALLAFSPNLKPVHFVLLSLPALVAIPAGMANGVAVSGIAVSIVGLVYFASRYPSVASGAALLSVIFIALSYRNPNIASLGLLQILPAFFLAASLLMAVRGLWVERLGAAVMLAATVTYAVFVVMDVRDNTSLKAFNARFLHEADEARERAGIIKLSER